MGGLRICEGAPALRAAWNSRTHRDRVLHGQTRDPWPGYVRLSASVSRMARPVVNAMSSRIASIETFPANYPVVGKFKFFKSAAGKPVMRETVLVKITTEAGQVGWGQSVPSHTWSYETPESVRTTIDRYLGPAL